MPSATQIHSGALGRVFGNLGLLLSGKAGAGLLSLAYLVIVARTLGAGPYGVLVLLHAYVTLVGGIIAFSGWHGLVRFGALAMEQGDHERLLKVGRFLTLVELAFGILAIVTVAALAPLVGPHMDWPPEAIRFAVPYSLATLANVRSTPLGLLQLAGRFDLIAAHHLVNPVVRLAGSVLVWLSGGGLIGFLAVWLAAAIAEWAAMWASGLVAAAADAARRAPAWHGARDGRRERRLVCRSSSRPIVEITLRELAPRLVPLAIGWVLTPAATGLYSLAQRASIVLEQPATLLGQASYSVIAKLVAAGDKRQLKRVIWRGAATAVALSAPVIAILAFFSTPLLGLLGGKTFRGGSTLLILLALSRAAAIAAPPFSSALIAMGKPSRSIARRPCVEPVAAALAALVPVVVRARRGGLAFAAPGEPCGAGAGSDGPRPVARALMDLWRSGFVRAPIGEVLASGSLAPFAVDGYPHSDRRFAFLADPFAVVRDGLTHVFVEALDYRERRGRIEVLTYDSAMTLTQRAVCLAEPWHLSYPAPITSEGEDYIPSRGLSIGPADLVSRDALPAALGTALRHRAAAHRHRCHAIFP